jgi:S1-C subfamily serine protease
LVGDIFSSFNGQTVSDAMDVQHALGAEPIECAVAATIVRGGELVTLQITPGERPHRSR